MKNKNLTIAIILITIAILFFIISLLFNNVNINAIFYDKPLKINDNYELGVIKIKNNFFLPQTIPIKYYFCYSTKDLYNKYPYYENLKVTFKPEIKTNIYHYYNSYKYYTVLKPFKQENIKVLIKKDLYDELKNYNDTKIYIVKSNDYFYCNDLRYNNNFEIIKEYYLKN